MSNRPWGGAWRGPAKRAVCRVGSSPRASRERRLTGEAQGPRPTGDLGFRRRAARVRGHAPGERAWIRCFATARRTKCVSLPGQDSGLAYRHTLEYIRAPSQKSLPLRCCVPGVTEKSHRSTQRALPQHREFHSLRARIAANQSTARRAGAARKKQQKISSKP